MAPVSLVPDYRQRIVTFTPWPLYLQYAVNRRLFTDYIPSFYCRYINVFSSSVLPLKIKFYGRKSDSTCPKNGVWEFSAPGQNRAPQRSQADADWCSSYSSVSLGAIVICQLVPFFVHKTILFYGCKMRSLIDRMRGNTRTLKFTLFKMSTSYKGKQHLDRLCPTSQLLFSGFPGGYC